MQLIYNLCKRKNAYILIRKKVISYKNNYFNSLKKRKNMDMNKGLVPKTVYFLIPSLYVYVSTK